MLTDNDEESLSLCRHGEKNLWVPLEGLSTVVK